MPSLSAEKSFVNDLFGWAATQPFCVLLDSCGTKTDQYGRFEWILAVSDDPEAPFIQTLDELRDVLAAEGTGWWFGAFSYEAQTSFESRMKRGAKAFVDVPELLFFMPKWVVACMRGQQETVVLHGDPEELKSQLDGFKFETEAEPQRSGIHFDSNFNKESYMTAVSKVREWIREGHTYELNLTQCFRAQGSIDAPFALWKKLTEISPVPFAGFARWKSLYLLSASPERFLQREDGVLRTQPIKGTAAREVDPQADATAARMLSASDKERAENVMIVDLSRNDLHKVCQTGTVHVPKLFEVQTFRQVHHLVSTIEGNLKPEISPLKAFGTAFPPGSMTGAPKIRTCELIEEIEQEGRGLYSGCLGYFSPAGSFDFNVVIRSLVYNDTQNRMSYHVGGAVTWDSDPEAEYAESLLKAKGIAKVMGG